MAAPAPKIGAKRRVKPTRHDVSLRELHEQCLESVQRGSTSCQPVVPSNLGQMPRSEQRDEWEAADQKARDDILARLGISVQRGSTASKSIVTSPLDDRLSKRHLSMPTREGKMRMSASTSSASNMFVASVASKINPAKKSPDTGMPSKRAIRAMRRVEHAVQKATIASALRERRSRSA